MSAVDVLDLSRSRDQLAVVILITLDVLSSGTPTEVTDFIADRKWLDLNDEDREPYPSKELNGQMEPRWRTAIAWARDRGKDLELIDGSVHGTWSFTHQGRPAVEKIRRQFAQGILEARRCYMWSQIFKRLIDPHYVPGSDLPRGGSIYVDMDGFVAPAVRNALNKLREFMDKNDLKPRS